MGIRAFGRDARLFTRFGIMDAKVKGVYFYLFYILYNILMMMQVNL